MPRELLDFEMMGESRRLDFESAVERHTDSYLEPIALEAREFLPRADRVLTPADWCERDKAFSANCDPLTGRTPDAGAPFGRAL